MNWDISEKDIGSIIDAIRQTSGVDFKGYAKFSLKRRISRNINLFNINSLKELVRRLTTDKEFVHKFIKEITVNTTEMFRDPGFWRFLSTEVLPNVKKSPLIQIWHAACSSGEEVYSMAILLKEMELLDKTRIIATDINEDALATARRGAYPIRHLVTHTRNYEYFKGISSLEEYYTVKDNEIIFDPQLIKNVTFKTHNLASDDAFGKFDLILCRNVLIYFDFSLQEKVLETFFHSLYKYGYLGIGTKESIAWCDKAKYFSQLNHAEKVFQKIRE